MIRIVLGRNKDAVYNLIEDTKKEIRKRERERFNKEILETEKKYGEEIEKLHSQQRKEIVKIENKWRKDFNELKTQRERQLNQKVNKLKERIKELVKDNVLLIEFRKEAIDILKTTFNLRKVFYNTCEALEMFADRTRKYAGRINGDTNNIVNALESQAEKFDKNSDKIKLFITDERFQDIMEKEIYNVVSYNKKGA